MLKIKDLREERNLSQSALAEKLNVSLRTVQNYEADQSKIPLNKLHKIYEALNVDLYNSPEARISTASGKPFYDVEWELGYKNYFEENSINPEFNIDFPPANRSDGVWMRGRGKSMLGEIDPGDYLYFVKIEDFSWFPLGRIYGVVTKNNMRTVKRITKSEKVDHYKLVGSNPDKNSYPDQDIPGEMIAELYEVKYVIKDLNE